MNLYRNNLTIGSIPQLDVVTPSFIPKFKLQVNSAKVSGTHTDFPAYVDLSQMPASFWDNVTNGGGDIRCYSDESLTTQLPREVVSCDTATDTGELHVKTGMSTTTEIYITVDGTSTEPASDSTYGSENVWKSAYLAVYHLQSGAGDSTSNGNNGTVSGATSINAEVGKGYSFDGSNDYISTSLTIPALSTSSDFYWSCISKNASETTQAQYPTIGNRSGGSNSPLSFIKLTISAFEYYIGGQQGISFTNAGPISTTVFQHHAIIKNGSNLRYYRNGSYSGDESTVTSNMASNPFRIGGDPNGEYSNARVDEVRIMNINPGVDWVSTESNNLMDVSTFWTITKL